MAFIIIYYLPIVITTFPVTSPEPKYLQSLRDLAQWVAPDYNRRYFAGLYKLAYHRIQILFVWFMHEDTHFPAPC